MGTVKLAYGKYRPCIVGDTDISDREEKTDPGALVPSNRLLGSPHYLAQVSPESKDCQLLREASARLTIQKAAQKLTIAPTNVAGTPGSLHRLLFGQNHVQNE